MGSNIAGLGIREVGEQSREDERAREHRWRGMEERTPKRQWCPDGTDAVEKKKEKVESKREKTRGKAPRGGLSFRVKKKRGRKTKPEIYKKCVCCVR